MESEVLCQVLREDVLSRLEAASSDVSIVRKKFELIENIAKNLKIGDRFKAKAAKILYPLCLKDFKELHATLKAAERFSVLFPDGQKNEDKELYWQVFSAYCDNFLLQDPEKVMLDKTIDTLPRVLDMAADEDININVFYDRPRRETISFTRGEVIDKFYSVPYGVCISFMGQVKTQMFCERHFKPATDEARRLDAMETALAKLGPAKFMLFALHFDKYIENTTKIMPSFVKACEDNVIPAIQNNSNKYLCSVGNMFGVDFVDYGSSGFSFKCLTTKFTPYNITRLCRIAEQIPSIDDDRFEKIRMDAIYIDDVFPSLRSYVHNQGKYAHRILKRMDAYFNALQHPDKENPEYRKERLELAIDEINDSDRGYNFDKEKYIDPQNYLRRVQTNGKTEQAFEVLHRLTVNTTPKTLTTPKSSDPKMNAYFEEINRYNDFPFLAHQVFGEYLGYFNNKLIESIDQEKYGISHNMINTILWTERKAFNILENMDAGYQLGAFKNEWFKNIIMFYELTNSASVTKFDKEEFNAFFDSIKNFEMEEAYQALSKRTAGKIYELSRKQRNGGNKYQNYLASLHLPPEQNKYIRHKMNNITQLKIDSNLSGYRLSKAIFNLLSPRRCDYEALKRYMKERRSDRIPLPSKDSYYY